MSIHIYIYVSWLPLAMSIDGGPRIWTHYWPGLCRAMTLTNAKCPSPAAPERTQWACAKKKKIYIYIYDCISIISNICTHCTHVHRWFPPFLNSRSQPARHWSRGATRESLWSVDTDAMWPWKNRGGKPRDNPWKSVALCGICHQVFHGFTGFPGGWTGFLLFVSSPNQQFDPRTG